VTHPTVPRMPPRADKDLDEPTRELVGAALQPGAPPAPNLVRTLAWYPGILRRWLPYGAKLLNGGQLPDRLREIIILRVAVHTRSDYEWSQHVLIGLDAGLTEDEIAALLPGGEWTWSDLDAVVIRAVDELNADARISAATWDALAEVFTPEQLVELPMVTGAYTNLAYFLNSFHVEVEAGLEGLPPGV
jgi:4-carboxymuconolactone decarboxylase